MLCDTTLLIDIQREIARRRIDRAVRFLEENSESRMHISVVTFGELAEGIPAGSREILEELVRPFAIIDVDETIAWEYASISRALREMGESMGDNDLWIAATAIVKGLALVTRDSRHFSRIPGLRCITY